MKTYWLKEIETMVLQAGGQCIICQASFGEESIKSYPHTYGTFVRDSPFPRWIYFHCQSCGYDSALHKIMNQLGQTFEDLEAWVSLSMVRGMENVA